MQLAEPYAVLVGDASVATRFRPLEPIPPEVLEAYAAFWQAALGYVMQTPPKDGWVILTDPTGKGPNISLDRVEQPPPLGETSRVHLDFYTDDGKGEVERLLALGATRYERENSPDDDFVVLVRPRRQSILRR